MRITIQSETEGGESTTETIVATSGDVQDVLRAHGHDPDAVDYEVIMSRGDRIDRLEQANGVGNGKGNSRGIAHRLDEIEDRLEALES